MGLYSYGPYAFAGILYSSGLNDCPAFVDFIITLHQDELVVA